MFIRERSLIGFTEEEFLKGFKGIHWFSFSPYDPYPWDQGFSATVLPGEGDVASLKTQIVDHFSGRINFFKKYGSQEIFKLTENFRLEFQATDSSLNIAFRGAKDFGESDASCFAVLHELDDLLSKLNVANAMKYDGEQIVTSSFAGLRSGAVDQSAPTTRFGKYYEELRQKALKI